MEVLAGNTIHYGSDPADLPVWIQKFWGHSYPSADAAQGQTG